MLVFAQGLGFTCLSTLQAILIGADRARTGAKRVLTAVVVALVLNGVLVPAFGALGAAVSAVASFAIATALVGASVAKELGSIIEPRTALRAVIASVAIGGLGWMIPSRGWSVLLELVGLGVVYLGIAWLIGLLRREHIDLLLKRRAKP